MPTYVQYSLDSGVRFKLELTREGNALRVRGDLTPEGEPFLLDSGMGLLECEQSVVILDMRAASASDPAVAETVARVADTARARKKSMAVLASGRVLTWLRQLHVKYLFNRPAHEPAIA